MTIACWSTKGGSGTTVVSALLAIELGRRHRRALAVDLAGDLPAVLGVPEPLGQGVTDWSAVAERAPEDGLARCEVPVTTTLSMLPRGGGGLCGGLAADAFVAVLAERPVATVIDCGTLAGTGLDPVEADFRRTVAASATWSVLVMRSCYQAIRRAQEVALRPSGVIVIEEPGRALGPHDVAEVLRVPLLGVIDFAPKWSRAVDSGLLAHGVRGRVVPRIVDALDLDLAAVA